MCCLHNDELLQWVLKRVQTLLFLNTLAGLYPPVLGIVSLYLLGTNMWRACCRVFLSVNPENVDKIVVPFDVNKIYILNLPTYNMHLSGYFRMVSRINTSLYILFLDMAYSYLQSHICSRRNRRTVFIVATTDQFYILSNPTDILWWRKPAVLFGSFTLLNNLCRVLKLQAPRVVKTLEGFLHWGEKVVMTFFLKCHIIIDPAPPLPFLSILGIRSKNCF